MAQSISRLLRERVASLTGPAPLRLLAAVSGGADSVAMLHLLAGLGHDVTAIHCNFHLRGEESGRDARFVDHLCQRLGVRLISVDFDTLSYAEKEKISIEMACRDLRYRRFEEERQRLGCDFIAVAHNSDDNIETLMLNLFRGTGLRGLAGMAPRRGHLLRPLITTSRAEIEAYLAERGETHITDSTNLSDDFRRNYIRLRLLPDIEKRWPGARKAILRTQENLRGEEERLGARPLPGENGCILPRADMEQAPSLTTLLFHFLSPLGGRRAQALEIAEAFARGRLSSRWQLPDGREAVLAREGLLILTASHDSSPQPADTPRGLRVSSSPQLIAEIKGMRRPTTLFLPADEADGEGMLAGWQWRAPRTGDRIRPLGMKGSQLVSDIVKDAHLGELEKRSLRLLCDPNGEIIWIPGLKRARTHLIDFDAPTLLRVEPKEKFAHF